MNNLYDFTHDELKSVTLTTAVKTSIQRAWRLTQLTLLNSRTNKFSSDARFDGGG
jgi:hypothetical protein